MGRVRDAESAVASTVGFSTLTVRCWKLQGTGRKRPDVSNIRVKLSAYPVFEKKELIFGYLGPPKRTKAVSLPS